MSQPVKNVMAPRLVAPRRNSRRDGSGSSFAASLISSFGSTPGITFRAFGIGLSLVPLGCRSRQPILRVTTPRLPPRLGREPSATDYHRAQTLRHQDREDDVDR